MGFIPENLVDTKHTTTIKDHSSLAEISLKVSSLPSRGLAYPKDAVVKYRPYTFGEIKQINGSKMSDRDSYEFILKGIAVNFDKYLLTASDALYLGFLRRISTLGTGKFKFSYTCEKCSTWNTEVLALDNLEFIDLEVPKLPITADLSVGEMTFDVLRMNRFFEFLNSRKKDEITALSYMCVSHDQKTTVNLIENCSLADVEVIEEIDKYLDHGLKPLDLVCKAEIKKRSNVKTCNFKNKVRVEGGNNLVQPFRESQDFAKNRIRFG